MTAALAVFLGGGLGAVARFGVSLLLGRHAVEPFPWATLAVNLAGCFAAGLLAMLFAAALPVAPSIRYGLTTGFLGGLTTFSAFSVETTRLIASGALGLAALNVTANVGGAVVLCVLGTRLGALA